MNEVFSKSPQQLEAANTAASVINTLVGFWLILSTFVMMSFFNLLTARSNNVIVGILVALFGLVRSTMRARTAWSWANIVLGVWLIISPFVLGFYQVAGAMWHNLIVGIIVGILAWLRSFEPEQTHTA